MVLDHLTNLNKNYHNIVNQLNNNLRPTRHLRLKFLANSRHIKNASEEFNLGLISIWQFLNRCSHVSAAYEQRQRNLALLNNRGPQENEQVELHVPAEEIIPEVQELPVEVLLDVPNQPTEDRHVCMVCMVATVENSSVQYIVLPCGHAWVCDACFIQLNGPNSFCPLCRTSPVTFQRIFFS